MLTGPGLEVFISYRIAHSLYQDRAARMAIGTLPFISWNVPGVYMAQTGFQSDFPGPLEPLDGGRPTVGQKVSGVETAHMPWYFRTHAGKKSRDFSKLLFTIIQVGD